MTKRQRLDTNIIDARLNFYDLVGYLLPGATATLLLYWFVIVFWGVKAPVQINDFGTAVAFFAVSYCVGNLVQALGNIFERIYESRWGGKFADQFIRAKNDYFPSAFKKKLAALIVQVFHTAESADALMGDADDGQHMRLESFHLCKALIDQRRAGRQSEIFEGLYGLYRGVLATAWIGIFVSVAMMVKYLTLRYLQQQGTSLPQDTFFQFDSNDLEAASLLLIGLIIAVPLLSARLKRFSQHYVASVYRSFFAAHTD